MGGEPTLQPFACLDILKEARKLRWKCAIETNGTRPDALVNLLPYLDTVFIDVKAPLNDPTLYDKTTGGMAPSTQRIKESILIAARSGIELEVRTTVIPGLNDDDRTIASISSGIRLLLASFPYRLKLQPFRNVRTLDPNFQNKTPLAEKRLDALRQTAEKASASLPGSSRP